MITLEEKERLIKDLEGLRINVDSETYNDRYGILELIYIRANEMLDQCIMCVNNFYDAEKAKQVKSTDDFMVKLFVNGMKRTELENLMTSSQYPEDYEAISSPIYDGFTAFSNDDIPEIYTGQGRPVESNFLDEG